MSNDDDSQAELPLGSRFRLKVADILEYPPEDAPREPTARMGHAIVQATEWALNELEAGLVRELARRGPS